MAFIDDIKGMTKKSKEAVADVKRTKRIQQEEKDTNSANKLAKIKIEKLVSSISEAAKSGKTYDSVSCDNDDRVGNIMLNIVHSWAVNEGFNTRIEYDQETQSETWFLNRLIISWENN